MKELVLQFINIIFLAVNAGLVFFNLRHSRKKDFEDQLYKLKVDSYKQLNDECHALLRALDINSSPIAKIYDFEKKEEWDGYWLAEVTKLHYDGFALQATATKHNIYLPDSVLGKIYEFSNYSIGYVTMCAHFDTGLLIEKYEELTDLYYDVVNEMRKDLEVDFLHKSIKSRLNGNITR